MMPSPPTAGPSDSEIEHGLREGRRLESPPAHVLQRAMAVWRPRAQAAGATETAAGLLRRAVEAGSAAARRIAASLTHDSGWAAPQALGLRSSGGGVRQMLFTAEGHDIDLRISHTPGAEPAAWQVHGQVLGPASRGRARLHCGEWHTEVAWNELCEFNFAGVPAGSCALLLASGEWEIEVGPIQRPPAADTP